MEIAHSIACAERFARSFVLGHLLGTGKWFLIFARYDVGTMARRFAVWISRRLGREMPINLTLILVVCSSAAAAIAPRGNDGNYCAERSCTYSVGHLHHFAGTLACKVRRHAFSPTTNTPSRWLAL